MSSADLRAVLVEDRGHAAIYDVVEGRSLIAWGVAVIKPAFSPAWLYVRPLNGHIEIGYMAALSSDRPGLPYFCCEVSPCCSVPWQQHTERHPWLECSGCGKPQRGD